MMEIIDPPATATDDDNNIDRVLKLLDKLCSVLKHQRDQLNDFIRKGKNPGGGDEEGITTDGSIRLIQGGRIEIFVKAKGKSSTAFDWIAGQIVKEGEVEGDCYYKNSQQVKDTLLTYAKQQALRDPRVMAKANTMKFDNFSLIVNYTSVPEQFKHIDLLYPNYQFGLMISDQSPATMVYEPAYPVRTVKDLQRKWGTNNNPLPDGITKAIENDSRASLLLKNFGNVLCPEMRVIKQKKKKVLSAGTLTSMPGSIVHSGPACQQFRVVLFFSGWPSSSSSDGDVGGDGVGEKEEVEVAVPQYNPDTQYFAPLLCCDLVCFLWTKLDACERAYLLTKMADSMRQNKCRRLHMHLKPSYKKMIDFTRELADGKYPRGGRQEHILKFATKHESVEDVGLTLQQELDLISVNDLQTDWEGESVSVRIYRDRHDGSIRLFYPKEESWEGNSNYKLIMNNTNDNSNKKRKREEGQKNKNGGFDGSNGTLKDDEGNTIECYLPK